MSSRPTWDKTWGAIANVMALRSSCPRRKVGAVLVEADNSGIIALGYNDTPPGERNCGDGGCPRGLLSYGDVPPDSDYDRYRCHAVHAEVNAIIRAGRKSIGATMYVNQKPCPQCQNIIMGAGVGLVLWDQGTWFPGEGRLDEPDR